MSPEVALAPRPQPAEWVARCYDSYRPGAGAAARILASALRRQGLHSLYETGTAAVFAADPAVVGEARRGARGLAHLVLVADEDLLAEAAAAAHPDGVVVVASRRPPADLRRTLPRFAGRLVAVDADAIAGRHGTDVLVPLLGAAAVAAGLDTAAVEAAVWDEYAGAWPGAGPASLQALAEAMASVQS